jgi:uncharacterized protein with ParB-like and HNH nuclease domain
MLEFMEGKNKKFIIPVYQRNYDWRIDNCRQLFNDMIGILGQNRNPHFFGSIVSLCTKKNIGDTYEEEYIIIDGQQRITTLTLVMIAMTHVLNAADDDTISNEQIKQQYLLSADLNGTTLKLKPVQNDELALTNAFTQNQNETTLIVESHITENYQYFLRELQKGFSDNDVNLTRQAILDAIKRLEIVSIELGANDDPQMIFESLNSTGLNLTEADKIRNYMLMGMDTTTQERFYHAYWSKIEQLTGYNVSAFIRDYITYKERRIPNISKVYIVFKGYVQREPFGKNNDIAEKEAVLEDLLLFAGYYNKIINSAHANNEIHEYLAYINKLKCKIAYPILLEIFYYNDVNKKGQPVNISDAELLEILKTLETFLVRRHICESPRMSVDGFLMIVGRDILLSASYKDEYVNLFKRIISRPSVFPNDTEFRDSMFRANFNKMVNRFRSHCFERLENFGNEERVALDGQTFEHIMPQTLSQEWMDELGSDYRTTHETYIHCIGNLTYTGYRKEMTNRPFNEKKTIPGGFNDSRLYLNEYIANQNTWNQGKIINRSNLLIDRAILVWPSVRGGPPPPPRPERYNLDDDFVPTGCSLIAFGFSDDEEIFDGRWVNFYKEATIRAYNRNTAGFREYFKTSELNFVFIGAERDAEDELRMPIKIFDDVYLEGNCSAQNCINYVRQLYQELNSSTTGIYVLVQPAR